MRENTAGSGGVSTRGLYGSALVLITLVAVPLCIFHRIWIQDFVNWDDGPNVYANPYLSPVTLPRLLHFWKEPYAGLYAPLSYSAWCLLALLPQHAHGPAAGASLDPRVFHAA